MRVRVTYAPLKLCGPTDQFNPYDPLEMTIEGHLEIVANWIDEHIVAGWITVGRLETLPGAERYQQGAATPAIVQWLKTGGSTSQFGNVMLFCKHLG